MRIRPATIDDVPSMMRLERQAASAGHWTEEQYLRMFAHASSGEGLVLVAEESKPTSSVIEPGSEAGNDIAGFLVARHLTPEWELENIVVAPTLRRKRLGQSLLDGLLNEARRTRSSAIFLEVRESNSAARALYAAAGFELSGRRKSYYRDPAEDAILYRKNLV